jgi:hypothetical protein
LLALPPWHLHQYLLVLDQQQHKKQKLAMLLI